MLGVSAQSDLFPWIGGILNVGIVNNAPSEENLQTSYNETCLMPNKEIKTNAAAMDNEDAFPKQALKP